MAINRTLVDILDETAEAFSKLDLEKLNALEQRIILLAESNANIERDGIDLVLPKKRQLEIILQNCRVTLDALNQLHTRNMRNQWAQ
jgi:hypothetical protein